MFRIGCHISSAGGYLAMAKRAEALGANTFAFFTRNPRGGSAKPIEEADIAAFHAECARAGIDRLVAHAPYTLNPCGSHKDRHAKLLDGCIPPEALVRVTRHPALAELPFILETPNDDAGYAQEIAWLRAAQN